MYPGQRRHQTTYNGGNYGPPPGPPPSGFAPPPGPPPNGYGGGYGPPPGPPPNHYNGGGYGPPSGPPPSQYRAPQGPPPNVQMQNQAFNGQNHPNQYQYNDPNNGRHTFNRPQAPPPSGTQHIGNGISYQYSQCNGQRKALLIGINYIGTNNALRGCINDAHAMQKFLIDRFGYKSEDMVMLTDDQRDLVKVPTRQNIIRAMHWLVSEAKPNDSLVFHYSGHGATQKNLDGTEESGYDSTIVPVDFQTAGQIIDDELHNILVRSLPPGARLTAFFDSCHSGTVLDLPFVYSTKGVIKEPNMLKAVGSSGLKAAMSYAQGNIGGMVSSLGDAFSKVTNGDHNRQQEIARNFSPADVVMISGSKDEQTSADATTNGLSTGAMSFAFINVMASQPVQSYISLLNNMRSAMSGKYSQKPQLSSSHPIDVNLQFIM
ncbi:Metacaspase-1A [Wickerhamomyces ciferrii]|uniref:Metacaspase-1 n=1 Tax=Wickerhamomyces ciferrii (strain ATCC 14091 / BCRC 22168 / CBS 111 / JCM 3599 / NBRC 0793 / NRRL Y-1031 F-60-10) TaxID=1206466 RepID=K0K8F3_WICCF|nr:Metacaspase-1A [Wickerhamomyces ciferrii]CCH41125.1 Metacaspase-1A [Wickerhamomyces ciferrii]